MRMIAFDSIRRCDGGRSPDSSVIRSITPSSMGYEREHEPHWTALSPFSPDVRKPTRQPGQRISPVPTLRTDLRLALDEISQLRRNLRQCLPRDNHFPIRPHPHGDVALAPFSTRLWIIVTGVRAAAFLAFNGCERDRLRHGEQRAQVHRQVPTGVVLAVSLNARALRTLLQLPYLDQRLP